mgnify:FL=1
MSNVQDQTSITKALRHDEVSDAILSRWEDAGDDQLSEDGEEASQQVEEQETDDDVDLVEVDETEEDIEEDTEPEEEDDANEDNDDEDELESQFADDDAMVEVTVDGKVVQQTVRELKRLAGQEASLTRKSQETASKRKEADEAINKNHAVFQTLLQKAEEKYKPYSEVDMLLASKTMDADDFALLRKEAQDAETELRFLREEADKFYQDVQTQNQQALRDAAKQAVEVLQNDIPEWSDDLYNDIRAYAMEQGMDEATVNTIVDPTAIKILHKARLFDQGKQVATVKKKVAAKKKVLRSTKAPEGERAAKARRMKKAQDRLSSRGSDLEDIADVLLARWEA